MTWLQTGEVAAKTLCGGVLVVVFALVSEVVKPKTLSGAFAAAPAVALAGMSVSGLFKGHHDVHMSAAGMIAGGAGIVAYCFAVVVLHPRLDALRAASLALVAWVVVAAGAYAAIVR